MNLSEYATGFGFGMAFPVGEAVPVALINYTRYDNILTWRDISIWFNQSKARKGGKKLFNLFNLEHCSGKVLISNMMGKWVFDEPN